MNNEDISRKAVDTFNSYTHDKKDVLTSQLPVSIRNTCMQTQHEDGAAVTECVRAAVFMVQVAKRECGRAEKI